MEKGPTLGQTIGSSQEHGKTTKCMVMAFSHGLTVEDMKESTSMTEKKEAVYLHGLMEEVLCSPEKKQLNGKVDLECLP